MKSKILLICLSATLMFNGCKKDDEPTTTTTTTDAKTDLLAGKNWMLTAYTVNPAKDYFGNGVLMTNLWGVLQPCATNNIVNYTTGHAYTIDEGATRCSGSAPQTFESGTWSFNSSQTHLTMTNSANSVAKDWTLVSLDATTLKLSESQVQGSTTYVYEWTYTKQ